MLINKRIELAGILLVFILIGFAYVMGPLWAGILLPSALMLLGLFGAYGGINTILKGRMLVFDHFAMRREYYTGAPVYLLGSALMFMGFGLVFYALWLWLRPSQAIAFLRILMQSPQGWGLLLLALGFFTFVFGVVRLVAVSSNQTEQSKSQKLSGFRIEGMIGMGIGILLIAGGFWLAFQ